MRLDFVKLQTTAANRNSPPAEKTKPSTEKVEASLLVAGDRAELSSPDTSKNVSKSSKSGFGARLAAKAKRLTLYGMIGVMGLNAVGPSIIQTADAAWAQNNQTEVLAVNQDLTPSQDRLARGEMLALGDGAVAYLADQGVKLHVVDSDAESAEVLTEHMNYPTVNSQQLEFVGKKAQQVGDFLDSQDNIRRLEESIDSLQAEQSQEYVKWMKSLHGNTTRQRPPQGGLMGGLMMGQRAAGGPNETSPMLNLGGMISTSPGQAGGLMGQMGQMGRMGQFPTMPDALLEANADLSDAKTMLQSQVAGELEKAALSEEVKPAISSGLPNISVDMAVMMSGAKTPAEKAEFRDLIYQWNGDRIQKAQADGLQLMEKNLSLVQHPQAQEFMSGQLEAAKANPDLIPMNTNKGSLLLPNFSYYHFEGQTEGQTFRIPQQATDNLYKYVQGSSGLYNNASRHSQVDHQALQPEYGDKVVVHELAHALDGVMEQENPSFHKQWHTRVRVAYESAEHRHSHGHEVNSEYGMTNYKEYVAEGVERLISDPGHLQETDPALFELSQELLKEANRLGNNGLPGKVRAAALEQLSRLYTRPEKTGVVRQLPGKRPPVSGG